MPKKRAITSRKAAKPKAPTKPAESTPEPDDELIRIEKAKHAAMCCLHSVARFVVASGRTLKGPKSYRVGINEELEEGLCRPPHQVLVEPLREAIETARECLKPILQILPAYGNGTECRRRSENVAPGGEWRSDEKRSAQMITYCSQIRISESPKISELACCGGQGCTPTS